MACLDEGALPCMDNNDKDDFGVDFLHTPPWNSFLREPTVGNV